MKIVIELKTGTTLAQTEEMFEELTENKSFMDLIEDIKLQLGDKS